jgi:hypothetical protein
LAGVSLEACLRTSGSPREGTQPTRFPRKSACIVGPVPSPGGFFNGLLARKWVAARVGITERTLPNQRRIGNARESAGRFSLRVSPNSCALASHIGHHEHGHIEAAGINSQRSRQMSFDGVDTDKDVDVSGPIRLNP